LSFIFRGDSRRDWAKKTLLPKKQYRFAKKPVESPAPERTYWPQKLKQEGELATEETSHNQWRSGSNGLISKLTDSLSNLEGEDESNGGNTPPDFSGKNPEKPPSPRFFMFGSQYSGTIPTGKTDSKQRKENSRRNELIVVFWRSPTRRPYMSILLSPEKKKKKKKKKTKKKKKQW